MLTQEEINNFKSTIIYKQSLIGNIIVNLLSINGRAENEDNLTKYKLINCYVNILLDYFTESDYENNNFFTISEIKDIIRRFNNITNSDYSIDL